MQTWFYLAVFPTEEGRDKLLLLLMIDLLQGLTSHHRGGCLSSRSPSVGFTSDAGASSLQSRQLGREEQWEVGRSGVSWHLEQCWEAQGWMGTRVRSHCLQPR